MKWLFKPVKMASQARFGPLAIVCSHLGYFFAWCFLQYFCILAESHEKIINQSRKDGNIIRTQVLSS